MINLSARIYVGKGTHIPDDITETIGILLSEAMERLYANVDYSLFRTDVDTTLMRKMIRFTFDGYIQEVIGKMQMEELTADMLEALMDDYDVFLKGMETIYYRKLERGCEDAD